MRIAGEILTLLFVGCALPTHPPQVEEAGRTDDPTFCVNVESDGRKYTSNNAPPSAEQAAMGVMQGEYPYPAFCEFLR